MAWEEFVTTLLATLVGGALAIAGSVLVSRSEARRATHREAQEASQDFVSWLITYLLLSKEDDEERVAAATQPLLLAVTRFRLAPGLSDESRRAGEEFHDKINDLAWNHADEPLDDSHRSTQESLEFLVRRDLSR